MGSARGAWSPGFLPPSFVCVRVFPHLGSVKGRVRPCPTPGDPSHAAPEPLAEWGRSPHPTRTPPLRSGDGQRVVGGYGFLTSFTPWERGEKCHGNESWVKVWSGGTAEFSSRFRRFVVRRSAPVLPGGPVWFPPLEVGSGGELWAWAWGASRVPPRSAVPPTGDALGGAGGLCGHRATALLRIFGSARL